MDMTLDELRSMAARAGLQLSENELQRLLPGANRSRKQAAELRALLTPAVEPAAVFAVAQSLAKK